MSCRLQWSWASLCKSEKDNRVPLHPSSSIVQRKLFLLAIWSCHMSLAFRFLSLMADDFFCTIPHWWCSHHSTLQAKIRAFVIQKRCFRQFICCFYTNIEIKMKLTFKAWRVGQAELYLLIETMTADRLPIRTKLNLFMTFTWVSTPQNSTRTHKVLNIVVPSNCCLILGPAREDEQMGVFLC